MTRSQSSSVMLNKHPIAGDARVVDDDVQAAFAFGGGHQLVGGRPLADVAGHRDGLAARRP